MRAIITGIGHYAPEQKLTNEDLEKMVDTSDEWIRTRTGIQERRILGDGKATSHMAVRAARSVLAERDISPDEIDLIIVATVTPDSAVPGTVPLVQKKLNANNCWGFDVNGGCSGFLCALTTGTQFIESGKCKKVLVIGADKMSALMNYKDRNTCVLFGDAAGAVLLEPSEDEDAGILDTILQMDGIGANYLHVQGGGSLYPASHETVDNGMHYVFQDGKTVFKYAVTGMTDVARRILEKNGLTGKDVKLLVPHQANRRIIDAVSERLELAPEQVAINIQKYGNTTAATIPMAMNEAYRDGMLKKGDRVVLAAFGAGFIWGSVLLRWEMG
jgi:3-oxoacyl-[acyl-carrier-protein] synthase-3